jgi:hypothetical protein
MATDSHIKGKKIRTNKLIYLRRHLMVIRETEVRNEILRGRSNGYFLLVRNILQKRALSWCEHSEQLMEENYRKICRAGYHRWKVFSYIQVEDTCYVKCFMGDRHGGWESRLWKKLKMNDTCMDKATRKERKKKNISGDEMDEAYLV